MEKNWTNLEIVNAVIEKLQDYKYLDDQQYASDLAVSKLRQKPQGKRKLQQSLSQKKLGKETVDEAITRFRHQPRLGAALWQAERADAERARAERERAIAEEQRDAAEEVAAFLEGMFAAANPFSIQPGRLDTMRIGTLLDRGASRIGTEFTDRPLIRARMQGVLGRAYRSLGMYDQAEPLLTQSLDTYRAVSGTGPDAANAMNALGNLYLDLERAAEAENLHREALGIRRQLLGSDHSDVAQSLNNLAAALQNAGRLDDAEPLYDELLALHRRLDPPDSAAFADVLNTRMVLAYRKFIAGGVLPLWTTEEVAEVLWERRLQVSLGTMFDGTYYRQMHLEDYVDLHIVPWGTPAQVGPFQLTTRRTIHHIPTAGLRIGAAGKTLGYSCDTAWDPEHMAWLESADTILHETSLGPAHTALFHLMELPESLRRKMYVVHYPDSLAEPDELRFAREGDVLTVGSAGRFV